jgi:hypothetical protein
VVNAPNVCYYDLTIYDGNIEANYEISHSSRIHIIFLKPRLKYEFSIKAVNKEECYDTQYSNCFGNVAKSKSVFATYLPGSQCIPEIGPKNSALSLNISIFLQVFSIIFIKYFFINK